MGSFCEIQIYHTSRIGAKKKAQHLVAEVQRLEKKYSRFNNNSLVAEINASAGSKAGIDIDNETLSLFEHARSCFEQSQGLFDITSGALAKIWDFKTASAPTPELIEKTLQQVGFDKISWRNGHLFMPAAMEIDFGGIVKEYSADAVAAIARTEGITAGLINLGGDFSVIGPQPDNMPWPVGIIDPKDKTKVMAKIDLPEGGLASSGDYERCFIYEGQRYSHILNPKTGWPSQGLRAVSVAADLCTVAGSVATIAMLKPSADAIDWLQQSELAHVYMTREEKIDGTGFRIV